MRISRKLIYSFLSRIPINIRNRYKAIRGVQKAARPGTREVYRAFDRHIMIGNREIPLRVFEPDYADPISSAVLEHVNLNMKPQNIEIPPEVTEHLQSDDPAAVVGHLEEKIPGVFIFFHGGGWVIGDIDTYSAACSYMANVSGQVVISVDYRLAPEHPYPAGLDDCRAAAKQVLEFAADSGSDLSQFTLIGDSAGANLAAAVSLAAADSGEVRCSRQILIYPATNSDYSDNTRFRSVIENGQDYLLTQDKLLAYMDLYVPDPVTRQSPYVSPVMARDLSKQPETLIITAEYDPLRDEGEYYGARLAEAGIPVAVYRLRDAVHGFFSGPASSSYVQAAYVIILNYLELPVPATVLTGSEEVAAVEVVNTLGRSLYPEKDPDSGSGEKGLFRKRAEADSAAGAGQNPAAGTAVRKEYRV